MRDLLLPVDGADLVEGADVGAEAAVDAQDSTVDDGGQREGVEALDAVSPRAGVAVLAQAFVVEAVHLGDLSALVVAPKESDVAGILELQAQEEAESFHRVVSPIHKVAQKYVRGVWRRSADGRAEEVQQVKELAVQIADDGDGRSDRLHIGFFDQQLGHRNAQPPESSFRHAFTRPERFYVPLDIVRGWRTEG